MCNEENSKWKESISKYCENPIDTNQKRVNAILQVGATHQVDNFISSLLFASQKEA
jgi:hypothetical protein